MCQQRLTYHISVIFNLSNVTSKIQASCLLQYDSQIKIKDYLLTDCGKLVSYSGMVYSESNKLFPLSPKSTVQAFSGVY